MSRDIETPPPPSDFIEDRFREAAPIASVPAITGLDMHPEKIAEAARHFVSQYGRDDTLRFLQACLRGPLFEVLVKVSEMTLAVMSAGGRA